MHSIARCYQIKFIICQCAVTAGVPNDDNVIQKTLDAALGRSNSVSGSGSLIKSGTGTLVLRNGSLNELADLGKSSSTNGAISGVVGVSGTNNFNGGTTVVGGTLQVTTPPANSPSDQLASARSDGVLGPTTSSPTLEKDRASGLGLGSGGGGGPGGGGGGVGGNAGNTKKPADAVHAPTYEYFKPGQVALADGEKDGEIRTKESESKDVNKRLEGTLKAVDGSKPDDDLRAAPAPAKPAEPVVDLAEQPKPAPQNPPPAAATAPARKVIRNGDMAFEVDGFDSAYMQVAKIVAEENGYISSNDSQRLPNGKMKGTVVVRVPPDHLDTLVLKLRALGDLKSQQITSQDVTKQYVDVESQLRAGRAMEERLITIIKENKGEVKDLLAAEKELNNTREKIRAP